MRSLGFKYSAVLSEDEASGLTLLDPRGRDSTSKTDATIHYRLVLFAGSLSQLFSPSRSMLYGAQKEIQGKNPRHYCSLNRGISLGEMMHDP